MTGEYQQELLFTGVEALRSSRNWGITVRDGSMELIDNSFDHGAQNVWVLIRKSDQGNLRFFFADDGVGIPESWRDEAGKDRDGIAYVLTYGGRIPPPGKALPSGKFGAGLTATATCLSTRTEIYSRTKGESQFRHNYYDFEELEQNGCRIEFSKRASPALWIAEADTHVPDSGTIIMLENVDNADYSRPGDIENMLIPELGRVYRKFLEQGKKIFVNKKEVKIRDPMYVMSTSREVETFGPSEQSADVTIPLDGTTPLGTYLEEDGSASAIHVRMRRRRVEKIRPWVEEETNSAAGSAAYNKEIRRWWCTADHQGFSVIRNGRELAFGKTLGLWAKGNAYLNYAALEIEFTNCADELFRVQTNKSRFEISGKLRDVLRDKCLSTINAIGSFHRKIARESKAAQEVSKTPEAEGIAAKAQSTMHRPAVSEEEQEEGKRKRRERKEKMLDKVEVSDLSDIAKKRRKKGIEQRFDVETPVRVILDILGSGNIWEINPTGDSCELVLNIHNQFYPRVYEPLSQTEHITRFNLFLMAIARAEQLLVSRCKDEVEREDMERFWAVMRSEVTSCMGRFLEFAPNPDR